MKVAAADEFSRSTSFRRTNTSRVPFMIAPMLIRRLALQSVLVTLPWTVLAGCQKPTAAQASANRGWSVYGALVETNVEDHPEVTPETAAAYADSGQLVVLNGTVKDVCKTMGCWLEFSEEGADGKDYAILVMNKDHAFFVPRNCTGRRAHAVGQVIVETHSVDMLKHLAADAGKSQAEIDAITQPEKRVIFIADAVVLPSGGLEKPVEPLPAEQEMQPTPDTSMTPAAANTESGATQP
jgi:hypothetical protein